jgi:hypothetical protein
MKPVFLVFTFAYAWVFVACGSESDGGGAAGTSGGGSGGSSGTTCADGYPTVGTPCAVAFETCKSCPPQFACCDVFECQGTAWAKTQSSLSCPSDSGSDGAVDAGGDAEDVDSGDGDA